MRIYWPFLLVKSLWAPAKHHDWVFSLLPEMWQKPRTYNGLPRFLAYYMYYVHQWSGADEVRGWSWQLPHCYLWWIRWWSNTVPQSDSHKVMTALIHWRMLWRFPCNFIDTCFTTVCLNQGCLYSTRCGPMLVSLLVVSYRKVFRA
jgi:hypothetical protein